MNMPRWRGTVVLFVALVLMLTAPTGTATGQPSEQLEIQQDEDGSLRSISVGTSTRVCGAPVSDIATVCRIPAHATSQVA